MFERRLIPKNRPLMKIKIMVQMTINLGPIVVMTIVPTKIITIIITMKRNQKS